MLEDREKELRCAESRAGQQRANRERIESGYRAMTKLSYPAGVFGNNVVVVVVVV